jgi:hypothetical protein
LASCADIALIPAPVAVAGLDFDRLAVAVAAADFEPADPAWPAQEDEVVPPAAVVVVAAGSTAPLGAAASGPAGRQLVVPGRPPEVQQP